MATCPMVIPSGWRTSTILVSVLGPREAGAGMQVALSAVVKGWRREFGFQYYPFRNECIVLILQNMKPE